MHAASGSVRDAVDILTRVLFVLCFKALGIHGQNGDGCGHTLLGAQSGTLASRNYPGTYPNGTRCEWRLRAPRGRTLRLAFGDFDLEASGTAAPPAPSPSPRQRTALWGTHHPVKEAPPPALPLAPFVHSCCTSAVTVTFPRHYHDDVVTRHVVAMTLPWRGGFPRYVDMACLVDARRPLCGQLDGAHRKLALNSSEVTVLFLSGTHRSGRGFLLNYATDQQTDLISCMERGTHFSTPEFRAYCPAGCKDVTGDIWGQSSQGYRDTSVLCKAAVHAGVASDELGGPVTVSRQRSITLYESSFANGLLSKTGSLSEKKLVFRKECDSQLPVLSYNASSSWEEVDSLGRRVLWSPGNKDSAGQALPWVADSKDAEPWLLLELQDRSSITGILTKGTSSGSSSFYTQSYTLLYSKDNKNWKAYKAALSKEKKVFAGNSDGDQEVLSSLIPAVVARYLLIRPQQWQHRAAAHVQVLGCSLMRPRSPTSAPYSPVPSEQPDEEKRPAQGSPPRKKTPAVSAPYSPVPSVRPDVEKRPAQASSQPVTVVVGVVLVLIVCVGILLAGLCWKRRRKNAEKKCSLEKGCQSSLGKALPRSDSELISYPLERGVCDVLPNPPLNDYAEPDPRPTGQKQGSTFRPTDDDEGYTFPLILALAHYDVPARVSPEYAEPLPPEPEYATPFGDQPPASGSRSSAEYDCPAHKMAPNGYCMPGVVSGAYARPSLPNPCPTTTTTTSTPITSRCEEHASQSGARWGGPRPRPNPPPAAFWVAVVKGGNAAAILEQCQHLKLCRKCHIGVNHRGLTYTANARGPSCLRSLAQGPRRYIFTGVED
ncbi:hypothetical protein AAFF_G00314700 [Aldrovandia affinis]|uniref:Discoidin, CUB and LCCL domain-containing protein 1-like n=1 Tax=Aldrovandia affinis TaxID=143900 RepID=A0AAD7W0D8_9TELE|nr:hypothetical protein AAFF_G00314700 [Aldrovandia affinis]